MKQLCSHQACCFSRMSSLFGAAAAVTPPLVADNVAIFVTYTAIILMASVCVWYGSRLSLDVMPTENMSSKDAYMFPIIGSATLFGLYLLFRYFSKDYINFLLTVYFLFFGASALTNTIAPVTLFLFQTKRTHRLKFSVPFSSDVDVRWGGSDLVALAVSVAICLWYAQTKHWILNNVLGLAFSVQGIALLSLGSYKNGAILLAGLFVYDVFWVFGTDVMVSVAKSFDAPIKLTFPRNIFAEEFTFSMLGLGDIVIPGFFVALLLRFDKVRGHRGSPFFQWSYRAYVAGLLTTIGVMHVFKAAQPALLYLVPYCLGASFLTAIAYGDWAALLAYEEKDKKTVAAEAEAAKAAQAKKQH